MITLGLKITRISSGVQELMTINAGDWTHQVVDIRNNMKCLNGDPLDKGTFVLMTSNTNDGYLLTLCRYIAGRGSDMLTAWIYVPANAQISVEEEMTVLGTVQRELSKSSIDDWQILETLFAKNYPEKQVYIHPRQSTNVAPAVRYYGNGTPYKLQDLLGDAIGQSYYTDHCCVFFVDRNCGIVAVEGASNYTDKPLMEKVPLCPPDLPADVTMMVNGHPIVSPTLVNKGESIMLSFVRPGYEPLSAKYIGGTPVKIPTPLPWKRLIKPQQFNVVDNKRNDLNSKCTIRIKGKLIPDVGLALTDEEYEHADISVTCRDYETFQMNNVNLCSVPNPMPISMRAEKSTVVYIVNNEESDSCPKDYFVDYEEKHGSKLFKYCYPTTKSNKGLLGKLWFLIIAGVVLLALGAVAGYLFGKYDYEPSKPDQPVISHSTEVKDSTPVAKSYKCLQNDIWKKAELENEPDLQGFYQDLISFHTDALMGKWYNTIDTTINPIWGELLTAIENNQHKAEIFRLNANQKEFSVRGYIKLLNRFEAPAPDNPSKKTETTHKQAASAAGSGTSQGDL